MSPMSTTPNSHTEPQKKRSAVQPDEIFAHLRILGVFHKLKLDVQARSPHNPTGLWTAFIGYAVEKFASWITNVVDKEDGNSSEELREEEFPTLDVAMVWHAYILNPLEYYKDCQKSHSGLMRIKAFPVKRLAEVIDTLGLEPRFPVPAFGTRGVRIGPQFSLDLVAAVKRQASFVAQVVAVGWTQKPKGIQEITSGCIDKYHGFLKKIWENLEYMAVPTLEIDLAWHTHQLNIDQYRQDSIMLFGRILQHDDDVPSTELNKAFRRNSYNWQNLFHMDYSAASISSGFRPVSLSSPVTPDSTKRSSTIESPMSSSEISLQEFYKDVSEKRVSVCADASRRTSSSSFSTPSSRESTSSPELSFHTATCHSRPSSAGNDPSPPRIRITTQILPPGRNDSTPTISRYPLTSTSTLTPPDSRDSSTSELGSIFAYTPPKGWNDSRGAFDRPPSSLKPSPPVSYTRPSSAGSAIPNTLPNQAALRRQQYRLSASAGALYVPEMSSPLSQPPEVNLDSAEWEPSDRSQLGRRPSAHSGKSSNTRLTLSRSSSALTTSSVPSSSYTSRPSSSGNSGSKAHAAYTVPKRPSTSGGGGGADVGTRGTSIRGSLKALRRKSLLRPTMDDFETTAVSENGNMKYPTSLRAPTLSSKRPSTAPQLAAMASTISDENEWPRPGGLFRKKSKSERVPATKRSWFRFW